MKKYVEYIGRVTSMKTIKTFVVDLLARIEPEDCRIDLADSLDVDRVFLSGDSIIVPCQTRNASNPFVKTNLTNEEKRLRNQARFCYTDDCER